MQKLLLIPVLSFLLLLGGCASKPPAPQLSMEQRQLLWESHRQQIMELTSWRLEGRLGLRVPGQSGSMSVDWKQNSHDYTIYLDGPLGQSLAKVQGRDGGVTVEASGEKFSGHSPEQLLRQVTGWDLPVSHLRYWVLGLPDPGAPFDLMLDNTGNPSVLRQSGWIIEYQLFRPQESVADACPHESSPGRYPDDTGSKKLAIAITRRLGLTALGLTYRYKRIEFMHLQRLNLSPVQWYLWVIHS